jgi:hypothetical protein
LSIIAFVTCCALMLCATATATGAGLISIGIPIARKAFEEPRRFQRRPRRAGRIRRVHLSPLEHCHSRLQLRPL